MARAKQTPVEEIAPDMRPLTARQAARLGTLTSIDAKELAGISVAQLSNTLKWRIDPHLLFFRRICGRVVKKDPATGVEYPIPFATVQVEDTDCALLGYFPSQWPWCWYFPLRCHREVLATVRTDKCGNFCVWIPWFDIDWILQWRRRRICFPEIFIRPSIKDLLSNFDARPLPERRFPPRPGPGPDPGPLTNLQTLPLSAVEALSGGGGRRLAQRLRELEAARTLGAPVSDLGDVGDARAFEAELPPPLPSEFRQALAGRADVTAERGANAREAVRSAVALRLGLPAKELEHFDVGRYIGPFLRCYDVFLPEWQLVLDVPDITFRVTQDIDGDGVEEPIYSESYFDVRWNAGSIPNVTLVASPLARESRLCDTPHVVCGNVPALLFAGLMSLTDPGYFDASEGYAKRPNRPKPPVAPRPQAKTPFLWTLQLYGCVNVAGASFYRVLVSSDSGATYSSITGLQWNIYPLPFGPPQTVVSDPNGWYPVLQNPDTFHPAHMVLEWPTPQLGKHLLKIEVADAAKHPLPDTSAAVAIQVDNTAPSVVFTTLKWKFASEPDAAFTLAGRDLLLGSCPVIRRGVTPQDVDVQFEVAVAAHHLRDGIIYAHACQGWDLSPLATPVPHASHWHDSVTDNSEMLTGRYRIAASLQEGAYTFGCLANSRAMNPAGADGGHLADWFYDPVYAYAQPEIRVAVMNA